MIYFKYLKHIISAGLTLFLFSAFTVDASECGIYQFQKNRSSGVNFNMNDCDDRAFISKGTVLDLSAKGRLWLKSISNGGKGSEFQMICQNRTENPIRLEFTDMLSPWLNQSKLKDCSGWIENKLSCSGQNAEKAGLLCVLSFFKSYEGYKTTKIQRTTSVKMRDIKKLIQPHTSFVPADKKTIIDTIKPELQLCKRLNDSQHQSRIAWVVDQNLEHIEIDIISAEGINYYGLFQCVQTVISTFPYPSFSEKADFSVDF